MHDFDSSTLRIDKWLWFARFYRTRSLARQAVSGGHVRLNGARARPGSVVKRGDTVDMVRDRLPWRIQVLSIPQRRGPATEARESYCEDEAIREQRRQLASARRADQMQMPRTDGRPDKRTRRKLIERRRRD